MDIVRLRFVGPERQHVPLLGRVVEPDELLGVPGDVYDGHGWAETLWELVDDPRPPAAAPAGQAAVGDSAPAGDDGDDEGEGAQ